ncbi:MAG: RluA family pseudouridine synthase [Planctomycetales bacterium]|nr:RluA family pseudouridine synthase [Planctomycetales bacterium]
MSTANAVVTPTADHPIVNIAGYLFTHVDRLSERRQELWQLCRRLSLKGTILLAEEGINAFLAGTRESIDELLATLRADEVFHEFTVKESLSADQPFRRLLVRLKKEIIAFGVPGIDPRRETSRRLPARDLQQWLASGKQVTLLDVRNDYEIELGTFANAIAIGVDHLRYFPAAAAALPESMKRQTVDTFCTGGIRCEKAAPLPEQLGFEDVYQLDGGILKYFEECGEAHYHGDCFVFDQRVALDPQLQETDTEMCFACQMPVTAQEQQSPQYRVGVSCPHCYRNPQEAMQQRIQQRHAQLASLVHPLPGCTPYENRRPIHVAQRFDGATLWRLVTTLHPRVPVEHWQEAIDQGRLQRNGTALTKYIRVFAGERIENVIPNTVEPEVDPRITILHEDDLLIVVHKPAPLPMHPCGRFNRNTLISILNQLYRPERLRVGHRLDANTTGVVVFSRTRAVAGCIQPQFERGEVDKLYLARVKGHPAEDNFCCEAAISQTPQEVGCRVVDEQGLPSRTEFRVLTRDSDGSSLLEVQPRTGRTNQIRLHLAHLGLPIVGDPMYGIQDDEEPTQTLQVTDPPLCLHAWKITLRHPRDGQPIQFTAPPPAWAFPDGCQRTTDRDGPGTGCPADG